MLNITDIPAVEAFEAVTNTSLTLANLTSTVINTVPTAGAAAGLISAQTLYDDFFTFWGITRSATISSCVMSVFYSVLFRMSGQEFCEEAFTTLFFCTAGVAVLNNQLITNFVMGRPEGYAELGRKTVPGVGEVLNVTRVDTVGTQFGYLADYHADTVPHNALSSIGFADTVTYVTFNDQSPAWKGKMESFYGVKAISTEGYEMSCLGIGLTPQQIVDGLLSVGPGEQITQLEKGDMMCTSYTTKSLVNGVYTPASKQEGLTVTLANQKSLAKKIGFKTSSVEEIDQLEEDVREMRKSTLEALEAIDQLIQSEGEGENVTSQGYWNRRREAQPVSGARSFRDEDGIMKTLLTSSYTNSYGPPDDLLR